VPVADAGSRPRDAPEPLAPVDVRVTDDSPYYSTA
jgi:hypothetical protein